ncbi:hypothetical protein CR152_11665 [Massilia violaceinigra]|uniref:Uncharacterized protein n=1 Tax=Massilia violaceinigra TaxID=2045208 RepID=A0A2D2DJE1_9BURK|nr:hypothetical protein [Massilia violaceinigra]ATQ75103.1 hypothetical protein CR152_11665 [Massilia violaceinigra]
MTEIRELDLSPFALTHVCGNGMSLVARTPLSFKPMLDETRQFICLRDENLSINVFAETRQKLSVELDEQILMLWSEYALAADDTLDGVAQRLKRRLLDIFDGAENAA